MTGSNQADDADARIAAAELRLAEALADLDQARETLGRRERELLELLRQFGRLPGGEIEAEDLPPEG